MYLDVEQNELLLRDQSAESQDSPLHSSPCTESFPSRLSITSDIPLL
jgi:hypothetical protein